MTTLDIADYKIVDWTVSKGIVDALWLFEGTIDEHTAPAFFSKIKAVAPDHNDVDRTPFVGVIPGTEYSLSPVTNRARVQGYDYAWYLTVQYVPAADRTTLIGTDPATTVTTLLGGASWATTAGVNPFRMTADVNWSSIQKVFEFGEKCTRWKAIQEICAYCEYMFVVKPYYASGDWYSYAYFIPESAIDSGTVGLDLPAMVTFTDPDPYLMSGVRVMDNPEYAYNRIKVTGYDAATDTLYYSTDGAWATYETAAVNAGTEIAIEYFFASTDLDSQAKVTARATELLAYFQDSSKMYVARFKHRSDLELHQKIKFSGYSEIATSDMRITKISYNRSAANDVVEVEFSEDQDAQQLERLTKAVNPEYVTGVQEILLDGLVDLSVVDQFEEPGGAGIWEIDLSGNAILTSAADIDMQGKSITTTGSTDLTFEVDIGKSFKFIKV